MIEQVVFFALGFLGATLIALLLLAIMRRRAARPAKEQAETAIPVSTAKSEPGNNPLFAELEQSAGNVESSIERLKAAITAAKALQADKPGEAGTQSAGAETLLSNFQREAEALSAAFNQMKEKLRSRLAAAAEQRQDEAAERARTEVHNLRDELRSKAEAFQATVEILRGEKAQIQNEFAQLRDERDLLLSESASLRTQLQDSRAEERIENAVLREHVSDIAAEVARLAINLEGINSPIERLIATSTKASEPESGSPVTDEAHVSLAERIRKLQIRR